jgi:hypothetical protein
MFSFCADTSAVMMRITTYHGPSLNPYPGESDDAKVYLKQGLYQDELIQMDQNICHDGVEIIECPQVMYMIQLQKTVRPLT